jgi:hypothetical protein
MELVQHESGPMVVALVEQMSSEGICCGLAGFRGLGCYAVRPWGRCTGFVFGVTCGALQLSCRRRGWVLDGMDN